MCECKCAHKLLENPRERLIFVEAFSQRFCSDILLSSFIAFYVFTLNVFLYYVCTSILFLFWFYILCPLFITFVFVQFLFSFS